jgi:hypothetical protein
MFFAVAVACFLLLFYFFILSSRNKYYRINFKAFGKVTKRIVKVPTRGITHTKLLNEVKCFNSLCLVAEVQNGVTAEYIKQMRALLKDINYRPRGDAYTKMFYAYACFVLSQKVDDFFIGRQLHNNLRWVFAPQAKIVRAIADPKISRGRFTAHPPVRYKVFADSFADMSNPGFKTASPVTEIICDSFIMYRNDDIQIKRYDGFYDISARTEQTVTFALAADKTDWDCSVARGVITVRNMTNGETKKYKVTGEHIRLGSSVAAKTDALEIYVTVSGRAGVSVDGKKARLFTPDEIHFNKKVEQIAAAADNAKFVSGENLRSRYLAAIKEIPSLRLLTAVYEIADAENLLSVLDNLECYTKAAEIFGGFNIVFLYSGGNDFAAKLVTGFISREDISGMYAKRVFMYFIDRTAASVDTIYYLSRMASAGKRAVIKNDIWCGNDRVGINELHGRTYPYTKTVVLQNTDKSAQTVTAAVPITFPNMSVVSAAGKTVTVVGLHSGRCDVYRLPVDASVPVKNEVVTDKMTVFIKTKLAGYEQRKFQIIKNENILSPKERKTQFVRSIENIHIESADVRFNKIFTLPVCGDENPSVLSAVKGAVRNADRALLLSVLSVRHELSGDVWVYLLNKIIGVRLTRNRVGVGQAKNTIQLVPNITLTGNFSLSFDYNGVKYEFDIMQSGGGCSINYGEERRNNFIAVSTDER